MTATAQQQKQGFASPLIKEEEAMAPSVVSKDTLQARRYRKLVDRLIACGIETLLDIPKIAIIGSQSAGKSSILEALSGITFPRASGTCTRCPSEVRLYSSDEDWNCKVSLRFEKDSYGNRLPAVNVVPFGQPITDPLKVQQRLIQAQKAILNPNKPAELYLEKEHVDGPVNGENGQTAPPVDEIQFSENVICIDVKGRQVRDLSLVDLPGLIANVGENEDEGNIELIKNLAKKTIEKPNCVILSCITMNEDFQTQAGVTLAKEADPAGKRTLGVLTKPDRIEEGTFGNWKPVLEGKEQKLLHGYYVVKNPEPKDLGQMDYNAARLAEKRYFASEKWASLGSHITSRLGSSNLAAKLSILLEQIIKESIPEIVKQVKLMHQEVKKSLNGLPKELDARRVLSHLNALIHTFDKSFSHALFEDEQVNSLADDIYELTNEFWVALHYDRPRFMPITKNERVSMIKGAGEPNKTLCGLKGLLEMREYVFGEEISDFKARDVSYDVASDDEDEDVQDRLRGSPAGPAPRTGVVPLQMDLTDIKKIKMRATRDMLPNNVPWTVKARLIELCLANWSSITQDLLERVEGRIREESDKLVKEHFIRFQIGGFEDAVRSIMDKLISNKAKEASDFVQGLLKLESNFSTVSTAGFAKRQSKMLEDLKSKRKECTFYTAVVKSSSICSFALTDNVDDELKLVAEVRAYCQSAFKRYVDNVRSAIKKILLQPIGEDCLETLSSELGLYQDGATTIALKYLEEDPEIVHIRSELLQQEATLSQALGVINAFWSGTLKTED